MTPNVHGLEHLAAQQPHEPPAATQTAQAARHRARRCAALRAFALELRDVLWPDLSPAERADELHADLAAAADGPALDLLRSALGVR